MRACASLSPCDYNSRFGGCHVMYACIMVVNAHARDCVCECVCVCVCVFAAATGRWPAVVTSAAGGTAQSMRCANGRRPSSCGVRVEVGVSVRVRARVRVRSHAISCWDTCAAGAPRTHSQGEFFSKTSSVVDAPAVTWTSESGRTTGDGKIASGSVSVAASALAESMVPFLSMAGSHLGRESLRKQLVPKPLRARRATAK